MIDLRNFDDRVRIITEINNEENRQRKAESLKRFEVYKERQGRFILKKLEEEFSVKTVQEMRKVLSINPTVKIINELANVYKESPKRTFSPATEEQVAQIEEWYYLSKVDESLKRANRYFKLEDQVSIQVVPRAGKIQLRVLLPHQFDVIPNEEDPEGIPEAYIISVFDKKEEIRGKYPEIIDGVDQKIADPDDYKAKAKKRYEVWTADLNFIMDGNGMVITEEVENPLGYLPFIDVATDRDFEYWSRRTNGVVEFSIEFGALLSDLANTIRLQSYAQAIVYAEKQPENMIVGPNQVLFMQLDPNKTIQPKFEFASPSPDLGGALEFLEMTLKMFLSSKGLDTKSIVARGDAKTYSSGVERLLAMIESFDVSKDDQMIFKSVEYKVFEIMKDWVALYRGSDVLDPAYYQTIVPDDVMIECKFYEPNSIQTKTDLEASVEKRLQLGLINKAEALMILDGLTKEMAEAKLAEIAEQSEGGSDGEEEESQEEREVNVSGEVRSLESSADQASVGSEVPLANTALNGAQVASLLDVVERVAFGTLPRETAINIISVAFNLDQTQAQRILGSVGQGFRPRQMSPQDEAAQDQ